jgi:hypothetical protein
VISDESIWRHYGDRKAALLGEGLDSCPGSPSHESHLGPNAAFTVVLLSVSQPWCYRSKLVNGGDEGKRSRPDHDLVAGQVQLQMVCSQHMDELSGRVKSEL